MTQAAVLAQSASVNLTSRNRIINGAMMIDQRNAGASVALNPTYWTLDRWQGYASQASKATIQQNSGSVTPPNGFSNYLGFNSLSSHSLTSTDIFTVRHLIEGYNVADLNWGTANAKTITLSFWARSSLTGTFAGGLTNNGQTRSYGFTYTISSANTWEYKTITIPGDTVGTWGTTNNRGIDLFWSMGMGSTYTAPSNGSWLAGQYYSGTGGTSVVGTSGATFYITGVQLEEGSVATPFEYRSYGQELALCQRYYENNYPTGTAVGTALGDSTAYGLCYRSGTATPYFGVTMQQRKRATPTFTAYNGVTGATGTWRGSGGSNEATTVTGNEVSLVAVTSAADSLIRSAFYTADAEL